VAAIRASVGAPRSRVTWCSGVSCCALSPLTFEERCPDLAPPFYILSSLQIWPDVAVLHLFPVSVVVCRRQASFVTFWDQNLRLRLFYFDILLIASNTFALAFYVSYFSPMPLVGENM
jgi:hypothetical protein